MYTREEIQKDIFEQLERTVLPTTQSAVLLASIVDILLDIRDLLANPPEINVNAPLEDPTT